MVYRTEISNSADVQKNHWIVASQLVFSEANFQRVGKTTKFQLADCIKRLKRKEVITHEI